MKEISSLSNTTNSTYKQLVNICNNFNFGSKSARNFNAVMCTAAKTTIVEVEEIVENGNIDPDQVHVPGIYVDRIVLGKDYTKKIEVKY